MPCRANGIRPFIIQMDSPIVGTTAKLKFLSFQKLFVPLKLA
jgi:hypothetical protein